MKLISKYEEGGPTPVHFNLQDDPEAYARLMETVRKYKTQNTTTHPTKKPKATKKAKGTVAKPTAKPAPAKPAATKPTTVKPAAKPVAKPAAQAKPAPAKQETNPKPQSNTPKETTKKSQGYSLGYKGSKIKEIFQHLGYYLGIPEEKESPSEVPKGLNLEGAIKKAMNWSPIPTTTTSLVPKPFRVVPETPKTPELVYGPSTAKAVRQYQALAGLPATGIFDKRTLDSMSSPHKGITPHWPAEVKYEVIDGYKVPINTDGTYNSTEFIKAYGDLAYPQKLSGGADEAQASGINKVLVDVVTSGRNNPEGLILPEHLTPEEIQARKSKEAYNNLVNQGPGAIYYGNNGNYTLIMSKGDHGFPVFVGPDQKLYYLGHDYKMRLGNQD